MLMRRLPAKARIKMDREIMGRKARNAIEFLTIISYPKYDPFKYLNEKAVRSLGRETSGGIYVDFDAPMKAQSNRLADL